MTDRLSETLQLNGVIIYESEPTIFVTEEDKIFEDYSRTDYDTIFKEVLELDSSLYAFLEQIKLVKPPQYRELDMLIYQAQEGNEHAINRTIMMYIRVVIKIALSRAKALYLEISDTINTGV